MDTAFLAALPDSELLARVHQFARAECRTAAALVAHLAEIENRKLYLREGCASMFVYCTRVLHLSEHAAYHRIASARLARRFPVVLSSLERGDLHLTALETLAPHLTPENHREFLAAAKHKSKREILELIARVNPKPDVAAAIRKVATKATPIAARNASAHGQEPAAEGGTAGSQDVAAEAAAASVAHSAVSSGTGEVGAANAIGGTAGTAGTAGAAPFVLTPPSGPRKAEIVPLAPERYKVQFTASADTCNKLRRAQELLRHRIPNGDVAAVVDQALDLLVRELERKKFAATGRPRRAAAGEQSTHYPGTSAQQSNARATGESKAPVPAQPRVGVPVAGDPSVDDPKAPVQGARSRHIPAEVKRIVWQRDHGRCTFMSPDGARCNERGLLEFDHIHPYADGGMASPANIRLLCRSHNQYESMQFFGVWQASTG